MHHYLIDCLSSVLNLTRKNTASKSTCSGRTPPYMMKNGNKAGYLLGKSDGIQGFNLETNTWQ